MTYDDAPFIFYIGAVALVGIFAGVGNSQLVELYLHESRQLNGASNWVTRQMGQLVHLHLRLLSEQPD
jgi:hypothetical protein